MNAEPISLYPNPTADLLYLGFGTLQGTDWQVDVIDTMGRLLWSLPRVSAGTERLTIPTTQLSRGGYCIRIHRTGVSHALRFIKQ